MLHMPTNQNNIKELFLDNIQMVSIFCDIQFRNKLYVTIF